MAVRLLSVGFNDDPATSRPGAVRLRRNASEFALLPEWVAGRATQFPAAYAASESLGARLFVEARLSGPPGSSAEVRALPESPFGGQSITGVLGSVTTTPVAFDGTGDSGPIRCDLVGALVAAAGVGTHEVRWRWQWRGGKSEGWQELSTTTHRVFTLLRPPTAPWLEQSFAPGNTQLPWVDVLEIACRWAAGAATPAAALAKITDSVFALGQGLLQYDCAGGAPTNYAHPEFDCTAFVERMAGGHGRGPDVNCTDCATITSTFANAVGCDVSQARMFNPTSPFSVNQVRMIGQPAFGPVCGFGLFNYHEVAWSGFCSEADAVFDACVQVLAPAPPATPFLPFAPSNLVFGWPGQGAYRDLLVAPLSRAICQAHPTTRRRRLVY